MHLPIFLAPFPKYQPSKQVHLAFAKFFCSLLTLDFHVDPMYR